MTLLLLANFGQMKSFSLFSKAAFRTTRISNCRRFSSVPKDPRNERNFEILDLSKPYPRDLGGYGPNPPHPKWPGDANICVNFVLNFEEGAERSPLHGDPMSEPFGLEFHLRPGHEHGKRDLCSESQFAYGTRAGIWRLLREFKKRDYAFTAWAVAMAVARNQQATKAMVADGHEIASHGYRWIDYNDTPIEVERAHMKEANRIITEIAGERPRGHFLGRQSNNTYRIVCEDGGFEYQNECFDDDLPYYDYTTLPEFAPQLIIPYGIVLNDGQFWANTYTSGESFYKEAKDEFEYLYGEGLNGSPKMMTVALHTRTIGRPSRMKWLAEFLDHIKNTPKVWVATRLEIARHWRNVHPPV